MAAGPARVCIDCRALVGSDVECDLSRYHRVAALESEDGRAQLRAHVWGPPELRQRASQAAKAGGLGAFLDAITCGGCPADVAAGSGLEALAIVFFSLLLVFLIVAVAYWLIASSVRWIRRRLTRLRPTGVGPASGRGERLAGRIVRGATVTPPIGEGEGVAWGMVLDSGDAIGAGAHLLFAGESAGFGVELDDGRVLEVAAGRARVDPRGARWERTSSAAARELAARIDHRADADPHPPIPADRGRFVVLKVGERVSIRGSFERAPAQHGGYRDESAVLRVRGVPELLPG